MSPAYFSAALVLVIVDSLARGGNWYQLLNRFIELSFKRASLIYLSGAFYGLLLPATVGTDAARAMTISRRASLDIRISVGSLVTLNLLGLAAVATLGSIAALWLTLENRTPFLSIALLFSGTVMLALGVLLFTNLARRLIEFFSGITEMWPAAHRILEPLLNATLVLPKTRRNQLILVAVALSSQVIRVTVATIVARSLGLQIEWWVFAAIAPLVAIVAMVPLSVLGVGLDQGAMVFLLSHFGVAGSDAFAISLTLATVYIGQALAGGVVIILDSAFGAQREPET